MEEEVKYVNPLAKGHHAITCSALCSAPDRHHLHGRDLHSGNLDRRQGVEGLDTRRAIPLGIGVIGSVLPVS